jgi:hypothetical protein
MGGDILAATTASIYPGFEAVSEPEIYNLPFNKGLL